MTPINKIIPNCLNNPAECVQWNSGNIEYLGVCNGDYLPTIIWEIVNKIQAIAGEDLSSYDIDSLVDICNIKAPQEITLLSILNILRDTSSCLKTYIKAIEETVLSLSNSQGVNVSLKCFADFDSFGNQLGIGRDEFDQLIIDKLCNHEDRILTVEGKVTNLQNQINNIDINPVVDEPSITTCVDAVAKPTSQQVQSVATEVCDIRTKIGPNSTVFPVNTTGSFANKASFWDAALFNEVFGSTTGWLPTPQNEVEYQRNIYIILKNFQTRLNEIETNCCAPTCDKIVIGFSMIEGDNVGDYVVIFRATDGNKLFGFTDAGSTVNFKDADGTLLFPSPVPIDVTKEDDTNVYAFTNPDFDINSPITVLLNAKLVKDGLQCEKCISKNILLSLGCPVCTVTASSGTGTTTIVYSVPDSEPIAVT